MATPVIMTGPTPPYGQVIFLRATTLASLPRVGPAGAGGRRGPAGGLRPGAALPASALARDADRLPAQDSPANRLGRGGPSGRVRRGAAVDRDYRRSAGFDEKG